MQQRNHPGHVYTFLHCAFVPSHIHTKLGYITGQLDLNHLIKFQSSRCAGTRMILPDLDTDFFFFVIILYTSCSAYDKPGLIPRRISWSSICAPAMVSFLRSCSPSRLSQVATAFGLSALILVCLWVCHILSRRLHSSRFLPAKVFFHRPCPPGRADQCPTRRALACWSPLSFCRLLCIR